MFNNYTLKCVQGETFKCKIDHFCKGFFMITVIKVFNWFNAFQFELLCIPSEHISVLHLSNNIFSQIKFDSTEGELQRSDVSQLPISTQLHNRFLNKSLGFVCKIKITKKNKSTICYFYISIFCLCILLTPNKILLVM